MALKILNKKHILPIALAGLASLWIAEANAAVSGLYVGGQLGWGTLNQNIPTFQDSGLAGRVFGGRNLTKNFGLEVGYIKFHDSTFEEWGYSNYSGYLYTPDVKITASAVDLVGKLTLPMQHGLSVFGKLGVAYLEESLKIKGLWSSLSMHADNFYPTFGLGMGCELARNVIADFSWSRIQHTGSYSSGKSLNSTDFVGLGLSYNFG